MPALGSLLAAHKTILFHAQASNLYRFEFGKKLFNQSPPRDLHSLFYRIDSPHISILNGP
jgi:hypothetical protein